MRAGPAHNDFVTPAVVSAASSDYRQNLANTLTLLRMLTNDAAHAESNKNVMTGWLKKYVPLCVEASEKLKTVWELQANGGLKYDEVALDARQKFSAILAEINLSLPQGVTL